jgi:hypothetical protein
MTPPRWAVALCRKTQQGDQCRERARRLGVEVERLARLPPFEWPLYLEETANRFGLEPAKLKQMVEATIKVNEKKAREANADDRKRIQRVEKDKLAAQRELAREQANQFTREFEPPCVEFRGMAASAPRQLRP